MNEENRMENILQSLDRVEKFYPNEAFISKMENMASSYALKEMRFDRSTLLGMVASLAILIMANVYLLDNSTIESTTELIAETSDYNLIPTKSLYDE